MVKRILNTTTGKYYKLRQKTTANGTAGQIMGLWSPKKTVTKISNRESTFERKYPGGKLVDNSGYYSKDYMHWAIQRDNFPHELAEGWRTIKTYNEIEFIDAPFVGTKKEAEQLTKQIQKMGGFAFVVKKDKTWQSHFSHYLIFYNPNGHRKLYDWVEGW